MSREGRGRERRGGKGKVGKGRRKVASWLLRGWMPLGVSIVT